MAHPEHKPDLFHWKRFTKSGVSSSKKVHLSDMDINSWIKRVEAASEFAISEVFLPKKPHAGKPNQAVALESMEQLQDHDEAYTEAQAILSDWMNHKLRVELEMEEEEEKDDLTDSCRVQRSRSISLDQSANLNYKNFDEMYSQLAQDDDSIEVHNFLQDLMEADVLESEVVRDLRLDAGVEKKRGRDPRVTMEMRHKLVKERRVQREAELEKKRRKQEVQKEMWEEAQRLEREEVKKKKQEARRQEELLQQEVVHLRRQMEEKRNLQQLAWKRERRQLEKECTIQKATSPRPDFVTQRKLSHKELEADAKAHIHNLQSMQNYFSAWYSVVLERRVRLGKAAALCDWRRQLRAWRGWRTVVWVRRKEKEAERTEEELRLENRNSQLAEECDRRRLLRHCLNDWRLWSRMEKERKELLNQQEETRKKMAALIDAATSGKLAAQSCTEPEITAPPDSTNQSENTKQLMQGPPQETTPSTSTLPLTNRVTVLPIQAWQMTRRHIVLSQAEAQLRRKQAGDLRVEAHGNRFEHRHATQQRTITEQRRLLREQQDLISQLQEKQKLIELRQEAEKVQLKHSVSQGSSGSGDIKTSRSKGALEEHNVSHPAPKEHVIQPVAPHPAVQAMEDRARQRAERRREVEEMKRRREEEKLAQMKAEEDKRVRQEEEEKRIAAEKRKEERKQAKEREQKKKQQIEREQKLVQQAGDHYHRFLLLHRGLAPWKQLVRLSHASTQKAEEHQKHVLQRRCLLSWLQAADEASAEKNGSADQLYKQILLRRALFSWKRLKELQCHLEAQAKDFYVTQIQRKVLMALLDHATNERLAAWEKDQQANKHRARKALCRCFCAWRRLPAVLKADRERETRREELRHLVAGILPDFRASPLDDTWDPGLRI